MEPNSPSKLPPSVVAVDVGNSFLHAGLFDCPEDRVPVRRLPPSDQPFDLEAFGGQLGSTARDWFVASVHRDRAMRLLAWVQQHRAGDRLTILNCTHVPLTILAEAPAEVGVDRLAAAVAANHLRTPGRAAVIIDSGTATTIDALREDGAFLGGAILPGAQMAASALEQQTDALPWVEPPHTPPPLIGRSTVEAIGSGLYWGAAGAVANLAQRMQQALGHDCELFLTGGGAVWKDVLPDARYVPDLTLIGVALIGRSLPRPGGPP